MNNNRFLAGPGDALFFRGDNLIGVGKTLTESTFNYSITAEEVRAGRTNALFGRYYHDSNLSVTITDAMFNFEYVAASFGTDIVMGGLSVKEEELTVEASGNTVQLSETPIPFKNTLIGWYKQPSESTWSIGNIVGNTMTITGASQNDIYCVKYFYNNENARSVIVNVDYIPSELHVVIINDLFSGDINSSTDNPKVGRLITDIPRLQLDGNQDLTLSAGSAATVSLTGAATAVTSGDSCEDSSYYATMTEEIFGETWQDNVIALAFEDAEVELPQQGTQSLAVRVIYSGSTAAQRKDNSNFDFTIEQGTATGTQVGQNTGIVTAGSTAGTAYVTATLKDNPSGPSAIAEIIVAG